MYHLFKDQSSSASAKIVVQTAKCGDRSTPFTISKEERERLRGRLEIVWLAVAEGRFEQVNEHSSYHST